MQPKRDRRNFIISGARLAPALTLPALASAALAKSDGESLIVPCRKPGGASADYFPNVVVVNQHRERRLFYDDLIRDKIVMINFMSIRGDRTYPVIENLVRVQQLLADRVGRDLFMYSITVDPDRDTPAALARFAQERGVGPGWSFLTGDDATLQLLRGRLFLRRATPTGQPQVAHAGRDCALGLVRYGNEALGRWGSFAARVRPESIAERFSWVGMSSDFAANRSTLGLEGGTRS